jgi:hypothetical protein
MSLEDIILLTQKQLFKRLMAQRCIYNKDSYILIPGTAPVMLLAHLDTVHKEKVRTICYDRNHDVLMSPQGIGGDDRCGVYALLEVRKRSKVKPWLLFLCDEEIGCVGARQFCSDHSAGYLPKELDDLKFLIEIDRKGSTDAVYYDCDNEEFEDYITSKGFKTDFGSCSDISYVAPELGVAAVNLSSGYYNAHTLHEYIVVSELKQTIDKVVGIVEESDKLPKYEYIEAVYYNYSNYKWSEYDEYWTKEDKKFQRDCLLELGHTEKELDAIEKEFGYLAIDEMYWDECVNEWRR